MLPKIHKSEERKKERKKRNEEYIQITNIKGRPVVAAPINYTYRLSILSHIILSPALEHITRIKRHFDFKNKACKNNIIGVAEFKSLYTNINHDLGLKAVYFWINKLKDKIPLLKPFPTHFIMEGVFVILNFNYFYINGYICIINNYYRFLDDIFFKRREGFDISLLRELSENIDPHIKYIFSRTYPQNNIF